MTSKITDYNKRRNEMINYLGGKCVSCSCQENLQFDHIDHTLKNFDVSAKWSISWNVLVKELDNCQLLCKTCHKEKTINEGSLAKGWTTQPRQIHGTVWSYNKYKCRCDLCKIAKSEARKRERAKKML